MPISPEVKAKIQQAFFLGQLEVKSVSPEGDVEWKPLTNVMRHDSRGKAIQRVQVSEGACTVTSDHSLFTGGSSGVNPVRTDALEVGADIVVVDDGGWHNSTVLSVSLQAPREWMYDVSVPGNESFTLSGSGILAHNSYSIGGVSLDIDKSSKYQGMMDSLQQRFEQMLENAHQTIKIHKGLQQPRYGVGARSAFGPHLGSGVLSPRQFVRF